MKTATLKLYSLGYAELRTWLIAGAFIAGNILLPQLAHLLPQGGVTWLPIYLFTLVAAYKFYCGKSLDDAHSAEADTLATCEVLEAQLDRYPELENDVEWLAKFSQQRQTVDFAGFVALNDKNVEVFTFGQHKGKSVEEVFRKQHNYYDWIMQSDFPAYTKKVLTEIYLRSKTNR